MQVALNRKQNKTKQHKTTLTQISISSFCFSPALSCHIPASFLLPGCAQVAHTQNCFQRLLSQVISSPCAVAQGRAHQTLSLDTWVSSLLPLSSSPPTPALELSPSLLLNTFGIHPLPVIPQPFFPSYTLSIVTGLLDVSLTRLQPTLQTAGTAFKTWHLFPSPLSSHP